MTHELVSMSLIVPINHLLPPLTKAPTHRKLGENKNSCYFFISSFYVVHMCCSPRYNRQRLPSIFISLPQKIVFPYYFIILWVNYTPLPLKMFELHSPPSYVKIYTSIPWKVKFTFSSSIRCLNYNSLP